MPKDDEKPAKGRRKVQRKKKVVKKKSPSPRGRKRRVRTKKDKKSVEAERLAKEEAERAKKEAEAKLLAKLLAVKKVPLYERVIYIVPYESKKYVNMIQDAFYQLNYEGLNIENGKPRDCDTLSLTAI